jgi:hypothetical protein
MSNRYVDGKRYYNIKVGEINDTPIGQDSPAAGRFTVFSLDQNVETLAANKTLTTSDKIVQKLDPGGASRDVTLPAEADSTDLLFCIYNAADGTGENLVVKDDTPATIITLGPGMSGMFSCDGTSWKCLDDTGVYYDAVSSERGIGTVGPITVLDVYKSTGIANIRAYSTDASNYGAFFAQSDGGSLYVISRGTSHSGTLFGVSSADTGQIYSTGQDLLIGTFQTNDLYFGTDDTARMKIDTSGNVVIGDTVADRRFQAVEASALTSTVQQVARLTHITSGIPAAGIGVGIEFEQETAADNNEVIATIEAIATDVTAASEDGAVIIKTMSGGSVASEVLRVASNNITIDAGSTLQKALSGDIVLECDPATAGTAATTLNAAAAGTYTKTVTINLKDAAGNLHKWASLAVNAATSEVVVDADVAAPTVDDATPDLVNGTVDVVLTYDTDAGATKTYAAGDTVTLTVSQPTDGILGYSITDATFVDTIV